MAKKPGWQYSASMYTQLCAAKQIIKRRDVSKPFYLALHTEEPHNYLTFFSYDCDDKTIIDEEFDYLYGLLKGAGKSFKGNLIYQLSLRYVDLNIKRLFDYLKEENLLNDTMIVITADHGSSYSFNPIRESVVNNFFKENYKTPLLIWDCEKNPIIHGSYDGLYEACDTMSTIFSVANLKAPAQFCGINIANSKKGREYIITEYMGPGCPDMLTRPVWMSIRNKNYMLSFKIRFEEDLNTIKPIEIYHLTTDKYEQKNLVHKKEIFNEEIKKLIELVKSRFKEIKKNKEGFINDLDNRFVILKEER